jgi:hypothetical protein
MELNTVLILDLPNTIVFQFICLYNIHCNLLRWNFCSHRTLMGIKGGWLCWLKCRNDCAKKHLVANEIIYDLKYSWWYYMLHFYTSNYFQFDNKTRWNLCLYCFLLYIFCIIYFNFRLTPRMTGLLHQPLNGALIVMTMLTLNSWLRPLYRIKVILLFK